MSTRNSTIVYVSFIVFLIIFGTILYDPMKFTLSTAKSKDIDNPVKISAGETIDIKVTKGKSDWKVYVYFDEDTENKTKLKGGFFSFKGSVKAPVTKGVHSMTIEVSFFEKTTYYYLVE